jgi:hypothetical protein
MRQALGSVDGRFSSVFGVVYSLALNCRRREATAASPMEHRVTIDVWVSGVDLKLRPER